MPKTRGAMDSRLENLEKTVESLQRDMVDREVRLNQQMGERERIVSVNKWLISKGCSSR